MKDLIVIIGTVMLGVFIFNMMVGSGENSLKNVSHDIMIDTLKTFEQEERY